MKKSISLTLPTTDAEFDSLVKKLMKTYRFKNQEHVESILANRIQHMPQDQSTTTLEYLAGCVIKSMAYLVARNRAQKLQHQFEIDRIEEALKENPHNQEAIDALIKAAGDGSDLAKSVLSQYRAV